MQQTIHFTKMHGTGNDYIFVNVSECSVEHPQELARIWSDRHKGIGSDGLVLISASEDGSFGMRIFNSDGSEAQMCGNAARCVGKYLYDNGLTRQREVLLRTLAGDKLLHMEIGADGQVECVEVDMGCPIWCNKSLLSTPDGTLCDGEVMVDGRSWRGTFVSMGNPHFVIFVDDAETFDIASVGAQLEGADIFPERCNIEVASVFPDGSIRMRVWERGSGITLSCGTGACATVVAAARTKRSARSCAVDTDGGRLHIRWRTADDHVLMSGPATKVYEGHILIP